MLSFAANRCARTLLAIALAVCASTASAQRVQFPTTVPGAVYPPTPSAVYPATPAPGSFTPTAPLAGYDPYANTSLGAPPLDVPYSAPPLGAQPFGAQPLSAQPLGAQPGLPAPTLGAPPTAFGVPPATAYGASIPSPAASPYLNGAPPTNLGGQPGTYDYQNPDGTFVRVQRLLQQISFEHTYLWGEHKPGDLAINRSEISATFGVPIFRNPDTPLLITPGFAFNWLEGPVDPVADLPPRVYDAYLDAAWYPKLAPWLSADLGVRTGVWTDFDYVSSHSIRVLGRGLGVITLSPKFDLLVGVWYIDRNDIKLLPAGGVHWRPNPDWDAYLVFPNPKIRRRFVNVGASQWWWYAAGEYGGGAWTVQRANGDGDWVDINDIRVIGGLEWQTATQLRGHVELGYVFNREIFYAKTRTPVNLDLDDTFMVRAGVDF